METKLIRRTIRRFISKNKPFFAHFCITHRCNLRCDFCQIWKTNVPELDSEKNKRIIDIIDKMGIAFLSITGGEPLLREEVYDIIDYAKSKKLYVRITSNGTLPVHKYEKLLKTKVNSITISLDGVYDNDLPHSKTSPKILETIEYIYKNKKDKYFSISTLLYEKNKANIREIIEYTHKHFPGIWVTVQPVVVGIGKLRVSSVKKVDPTILHNMDILDPEFFIDACIDYFNLERFDWYCKAGVLFFDIAPNGDFWICQDFSTTLNVLVKDFLRKWKNYDFHNIIKNCSGCIYSCYYLSQKSLEIKNGLAFIKKYKKYKTKY